MVEAAEVMIEGFTVISVGRQVLCRAFRASGCFFRFLTLKKPRNTKTGLEIDTPFSCDQPLGSLFSL